MPSWRAAWVDSPICGCASLSRSGPSVVICPVRAKLFHQRRLDPAQVETASGIRQAPGIIVENLEPGCSEHRSAPDADDYDGLLWFSDQGQPCLKGLCPGVEEAPIHVENGDLVAGERWRGGSLLEAALGQRDPFHDREVHCLLVELKQ